jgi:hypothetical protein
MAFQISAIGRSARLPGWATNVRPSRASAPDRLPSMAPTSLPIGQSGSRHRTIWERPVRRVRAAAEGAYPRRAAASSTRDRVPALIVWCGVSLST